MSEARERARPLRSAISFSRERRGETRVPRREARRDLRCLMPLVQNNNRVTRQLFAAQMSKVPSYQLSQPRVTPSLFSSDVLFSVFPVVSTSRGKGTALLASGFRRIFLGAGLFPPSASLVCFIHVPSPHFMPESTRLTALLPRAAFMASATQSGTPILCHAGRPASMAQPAAYQRRLRIFPRLRPRARPFERDATSRAPRDDEKAL